MSYVCEVATKRKLNYYILFYITDCNMSSSEDKGRETSSGLEGKDDQNGKFGGKLYLLYYN